MHWNLLPAVMIKFGQQDALSYLLYLVGGCVVAFHLDEAHAWVCGPARLIAALTAAAALAAEGIYFLAANGVATVLGSGNDPFQPSVIPFNIGAVSCGYLAGVALVKPQRSRRVRAAVRSGSDSAYGIYLSHMLFITTLTWVGWGQLSAVIPWPVLCLATVAIVIACGAALTGVLARTPLAVPLTGRPRVRRRRPGPLPPQPAAAVTAGDAATGAAAGDAVPGEIQSPGGLPSGRGRPGQGTMLIRNREAPPGGPHLE